MRISIISIRRTLHRFSNRTAVITAPRTRDLLRWMCFRDVTELRWGEERKVALPNESVTVKAIRVNHWGARMLRDTYRGYNGYIIERNGRRIIFGGDTAFTDAFAELRDDRPYDLAIMSIGAYNPWIRVHANPEQVIAMCDAAGVRYLMPVHHQTFRLSVEPFREPIERFETALQKEPERIALREIGETFVLPGASRTADTSIPLEKRIFFFEALTQVLAHLDKLLREELEKIEPSTYICSLAARKRFSSTMGTVCQRTHWDCLWN